jgi:hypothetical protein
MHTKAKSGNSVAPVMIKICDRSFMVSGMRKMSAKQLGRSDHHRVLWLSEPNRPTDGTSNVTPTQTGGLLHWLGTGVKAEEGKGSAAILAMFSQLRKHGKRHQEDNRKQHVKYSLRTWDA